MTKVLATFRRPDTTGWDDAWVGVEPTFQSKKSVRKWTKLSQTKKGEDEYFVDPYMRKTQRGVARAIVKSYRERLEQGKDPACLFARVKVKEELDPWKVKREEIAFEWADRSLEPLEVRWTLDP